MNTTLTRSTPTRRSRFCCFLVARGYCDEDQARVALERAWESAPPLGKLLVSEGVLTVHQLMVVLERQADEPEVPIGQLAIRQGYCRERDVQRVLVHQRRMRKHPVEVLVEMGIFDGDEAGDLLVEFAKILEFEP